jgi:hypothetical protein
MRRYEGFQSFLKPLFTWRFFYVLTLLVTLYTYGYLIFGKCSESYCGDIKIVSENVSDCGCGSKYEMYVQTPEEVKNIGLDEKEYNKYKNETQYCGEDFNGIYIFMIVLSVVLTIFSFNWTNSIVIENEWTYKREDYE